MIIDLELASNIAGYLSIVCWIIVFIPQLWENYVRKSGDGISMTFLTIWLAGDIFNLAGVILQDLLPTMFLLALWYTVADLGLIWQVIYYQRLTEKSFHDDEEVTLINNENSTSKNYNTVQQQKQQKSSTQENKLNIHYDKKITFWFNIISVITILLVFIVSCISYGWNHYYHHQHQPSGDHGKEDHFNEMLWFPQLLGYISCVLYIGSRIPQIIQNYRKKSTEGLSLGMFLCALFGNIFFTLSIFLRSTDPEYLLINLSWIAGSCGTLVFDFVIFAQFYLYDSKKEHRKSHDYVE